MAEVICMQSDMFNVEISILLPYSVSNIFHSIFKHVRTRFWLIFSLSTWVLFFNFISLAIILSSLHSCNLLQESGEGLPVFIIAPGAGALVLLGTLNIANNNNMLCSVYSVLCTCVECDLAHAFTYMPVCLSFCLFVFLYVCMRVCVCMCCSDEFLQQWKIYLELQTLMIPSTYMQPFWFL